MQSSIDLTPEQEKAVQVNLSVGDIVASNCDVMINTTGPDFDLTSTYYQLTTTL